MNSEISLLTVFTPVTPGREDVLDSSLRKLWTGASPFADLAFVHFARWVIIGDVRGNLPHLPLRRHRLRMKYCLFTCAFDGPTSLLLDNLRSVVGPTADEIWGNCVGYPGLADPQRFAAYFTHNTLSIPHRFAAYSDSVPEIRKALQRRRKHIELAEETQGMKPDQLLAAFQAKFR